jgi:hypothetical protein
MLVPKLAGIGEDEFIEDALVLAEVDWVVLRVHLASGVLLRSLV